MPSALTVVNWCPGDACDPCGCALARIHPASATIDGTGQLITETWGPAVDGPSITGKALCDPRGLVQIDAGVSAGPISPPYKYTYDDGFVYTGQFGTEPARFLEPGHFPINDDGGFPQSYTLTITTPWFTGTVSDSETVPEILNELIYIGSTFTVTASTTGWFSSGSPGTTYPWSGSDSIFIGGLAAYYRYLE